MRRTLGPLLPALLVLLLAAGSAAIPCPRSPWKGRLDTDISRFEEDGITLEDITEAARRPCGGYIVSIVDSKLYAQPLGWEAGPETVKTRLKSPHDYLRMFANLLCIYKDIPPVTFVINTYDRLCVEKRSVRPVPVFSWGKDTLGDDNQILVPSMTFLYAKGYAQLLGTGPPWSERKEIAVWRGATTGGMYTNWNWMQFARSQLVKTCMGSKLCNAKFASYPQSIPEAEQAIRASGGHGEQFNMTVYQQHKYVVVNDGNMAPGGDLLSFLYSGSAIMKQESPSIEFYYDDLKPFKHYIPLSFKHGDIENKVKWAQSHDAEVKQIAANAGAYAKQHLTEANAYCHLYRLLGRYSAAQRFSAGYYNTSWQLVSTNCTTFLKSGQF